MIDTQETIAASPQERETMLETLLIQAELGHDEVVRVGVAALHPADMAELLNALEEPEVKQKLFAFLAPEQASAVLSVVSSVTRTELVQNLTSETLAQLLGELDSDDAADLLAALPQPQARAVLTQVSAELSAEMQQLLRYRADTAGGIMQTEHVAVPVGTRIEQAIEMVRGHVEDVPDIHSVFIVDHAGRLVGMLPLRKLILARPQELVETVMDRQVISVRADLDQEQVAHMFKRYDLVSLPVVGGGGQLLGRITIDDVVDVLEEEATEDIYKLAGLGGQEVVFDSPLRSMRRRLPWLALNLGTTALGATVISLFEQTIETVAIAAAFMTIVAAQGGNAGVQTLTVIVRGLALGEVTLAQTRRLLWKELRVALGNGVLLGCGAGVIAYLWKGNPLLGAVLAVALVTNFAVGACVGTMIPLTLRRFGIDPAIASNVFVTACTDICGFLSFLGILTLLLQFLS